MFAIRKFSLSIAKKCSKENLEYSSLLILAVDSGNINEPKRPFAKWPISPVALNKGLSPSGTANSANPANKRLGKIKPIRIPKIISLVTLNFIGLILEPDLK